MKNYVIITKKYFSKVKLILERIKLLKVQRLFNVFKIVNNKKLFTFLIIF